MVLNLPLRNSLDIIGNCEKFEVKLMAVPNILFIQCSLYNIYVVGMNVYIAPGGALTIIISITK